MNDRALSFDGINDLVSNVLLTDIADSFTIEFWVNSTATRNSTPQNNTGIYGTQGQRYAIVPEWGTSIGVNHAIVGVSVGTNGISVFEHANFYLPSPLVYDTSLSGWNHIAVVYNNKTPSLYLNGQFIKTGLTSTYIVHPSAELGHIANYGPFQGSIDELRIWQQIRTPEEILANMNRELIGNEPNLIGYWQFNEGLGATLFDLTVNNRDGILTGPTWTTGVTLASASPPVSTISFSEANYQINENGTTVVPIAIVRNNNSDGEISVTLELQNLTAKEGQDYSNNLITVILASGETSKTIEIPIIEDALLEGKESLQLLLKNPTGGATLGTQNTAILTILDNELSIGGNWTPITNGGFETGNLNDWSQLSNGNVWSIENQRTLFGNFSTKANTSRSFNGPGYALIKNINGLVAGQRYVLSAFIYTGEATSGSTYIDLNDIPNDPSPGGANGVPEWQFVWQEFVAPSSQVTVRLVRDGNVKAGEFVYIDEVAITPASKFQPVSTNLPDLIGSVPNNNAPLIVNLGETISLNWTVTNQGQASALNNWYDRVYISDDTTVDDGDLLLTQEWIDTPTPLEVGNSYTIEKNVTILNTSPGQRYLLFAVDGDRHQSESDEENNLVVKPIEILAPDLLVTNIVVPIEGWSGQTIDLSWTVTNNGTDATRNDWTDRVYLTSNNQPNSSIYLGELIRPLELNLGQSYTRTQTFTLPEGIRGDYAILVTTDANNIVLEGGIQENNNSSLSEIFPINLSPYADLQITSISIPNGPIKAGKDTTFAWVVSNRGTGATNASIWYDALYLSSDRNFSSDDILLGRASNPNYLRVGESYLQNLTVTIPNNLNGQYYAIAIADSNNSQVELAFENNNILTSIGQLAIEPPPLGYLHVVEVKLAVNTPSTLYPGQTLSVSWTVENTGEETILPGNIGYWDDAFALSPTPNWNGVDGYWLGGHQSHRYKPLAPGENYTYNNTITLPNNIAGTWYLVSIPDIHYLTGGGGVGSSNIPRDIGFVSLNIQQPPSSDLQVISVNVSPTAFSESPVSVSWTVSNEGFAPTPQDFWLDRVYLSTDTNLDRGSDILLGTFTRLGALDSVRSYHRNESLFLPAGISGNYYILVETDSTNLVRERADEYNAENNNINVSSQNVRVELTPPPDLQTTSLLVANSVKAGRELEVEWTVANRGLNATNISTWFDRLLISQDEDLDTINDNIELAVVKTTGGLNVDRSYTLTQNVVLPSHLTGNYHLLAIADSNNVVAEYGLENNNAASTIINVNPLLVDLQITNLNVPIGLAGQDLFVNWTISNLGSDRTAILESNWVDYIYLSTDASLDFSTDLLLGKFARQGPLESGASYNGTAIVKLPRELAGNYQLFLVTDREGQVFETNNNNNTQHSSLRIETSPLPDFQVTEIDTNSSISSGQAITIDWTVTNLGEGSTSTFETNWTDTIYLSLDNNLDLNVDLLLGRVRHSGSLDKAEFYRNSETFLLPVEISGNYKVLIATDAGKEVLENQENNNLGIANLNINLTPPPDLQVSNVSAPEFSYSGQPITLNWTVNNVGTGNTLNSTWFDGVYLSKDRFFDRQGDIFLGYAKHEGILTTGGNYQSSLTATLPTSASGPYYAFVITDLNSQVFEGVGENNNNDYDRLAVQIELPPPADLIVTDISLPTSGIVGEIPSTAITWTVTNQGTNTAAGNWFDAVYLSADRSWDLDDPLIAKVEHLGELAPGAFYTATTLAPLPPALPNNYRAIVRSDIRNNIRESSETNNQEISAGRLALDLPQLTFSSLLTDTIDRQQERYYRLFVEAGEDILLKANFSTLSQAEFYVRYGTPPTLSNYDRLYNAPNDLQQAIKISGTRPGNYYIMVRGKEGISEDLPFTLEAERLDFGISAITIDRGTNLGLVTTIIDGAKFNLDSQVSLIASDGTKHQAIQTLWQDSTQLWATFDLQGLPFAVYDLEVSQGTQTTKLEDAFIVETGIIGNLETRIVTPSAVKPGQPIAIAIEYTNRGDTDTIAPLLSLSVENGLIQLPGESNFNNSNYQFLGISDRGPAGILAPGTTNRATVIVKPISNSGEISLKLQEIASEQTIAWKDLSIELGLQDLPVAAQNQILANLTERIGTTAGDYQKVLAENATYLSSLGDRTNDIKTLLNLTLQQASNYQTIEQKEVNDSFGFGWTWVGEIRAEIDNEGNVTIVDGGMQNLFAQQLSGTPKYILTPSTNELLGSPYKLDIEQFMPRQGIASRHTFTRQSDGSYDKIHRATLSRDADGYQLQTEDGKIYVFLPNGELNWIGDLNGYKIQAQYTDGELTSLTASNGDRLNFERNSQQKIISINDRFGETANFNYDRTGQYLVNFTSPTTNTTFGYNNAANPTALTDITYGDGSKITYNYDTQGRLIQQLGLEEERLTYTYDSNGVVEISDLNNAKTKIWRDDKGNINRILDPLNRLTQFEYDAEGNLLSITDPQKLTTSFKYDELDNLVSQIDPLGQEITYTYYPNTHLLKSFTDSRQNGLQYEYDTGHNLTKITYGDGSNESFEYDDRGLLIKSINSRSQEITYNYNDKYQLIEEVHSDGTSLIYSYDEGGQVKAIADARGNTSITYDRLNHQMTLSYDTGRSIVYTFDAFGRKTQMVADGAIVNYTYDSSDRLARLEDGNGNLIVSYIYDSATSLLAREDRGNGTHTTYTYDRAGQLIALVNYAGNGEINSRFDYTYNVSGQTIATTSLDGKWDYTYDATGQLIEAIFTATNPELGYRHLTYQYDRAGNRIQTIIDGEITNYQSNNLNQYANVGNVVYNYDADGNLISKIDGNKVWNYSYDNRNRLQTVIDDRGDRTDYEYDVFGNRRATIYNGQRTEYLVDPFNSGNIVAEYDGDGISIAKYTHGIGLVSRTSINSTAYYDFDILGSTVGLTGNNGVVLNQYKYLPFGEDYYERETIPNPFEFVGEYGVMEESNGLDFMRARFYDPQIGKFTARDPIGLQGEDTNLYRYVRNQPLNYVDSKGTALQPLTPSFYTNGLVYGLSLGAGLSVGNAFKCFSPEAKIFFGIAGVLLIGGVTLASFGTATPAIVSALLFGGGYWLGSNQSCNPPTSTGGLPNPFGDPANAAEIPIVTPHDPNDIIGPKGFGEEGWIGIDLTLPYTIRFENQATATAPAQQVKIFQKIDTDLDLRTFRLGDFGWGDLYIDVPDNVSFYNQRLDLTKTHGFYVDVAAGIDVAKGEVFWILTTIDPQTGEKPENPLIGFLPPNNADGVGDGFVNYSIRPRQNALTGNIIEAEATIIFDSEVPIDTPRIFNTIDAAIPVSNLEALPPTIETETVSLKWYGSDAPNGSGFANYTIYVAKDGGAFVPWLENTTLTEATFTGEAGHSYSFYSIAKDNADNQGVISSVPQASTKITGRLPILTINNLLALDEGSNKTLSSSILQVVDGDDTPEQIAYQITTLPARGTLKLNERLLQIGDIFTQAELNSNLLLYQHDGSETTSDLFKFQVTDRRGNHLDETTFNISIIPVNDSPLANNDLAVTNTDKPLTIFIGDLLANDFDVEGDNLSIIEVKNPHNGNVVISDGDRLIFTPNTGFVGTASFEYILSDRRNGMAIAQVSITVNAANLQFNGTNSRDTLVGSSGNDTLNGFKGNDWLEGKLGGDRLNGGQGIDTLIGGLDNDLYIVDNLSDLIIEQIEEGIDSVVSSVNWALADNLENLTLSSNSIINGNGNNLNNILRGNTENNWLWGGQGNDTLKGNNGDDTLDGDIGIDYLDGGNGNDWLRGDIGNDILLGKSGKDSLSGGGGNDTLNLGSDSEVDTVFYNYLDGQDLIQGFVRGLGGDLLAFNNIAAIDVVKIGKRTEFHLSDGITNNTDFGKGELLITIAGVTDFTVNNIADNLAISNAVKFCFS
jgi:RHS repeat-associated protein